MPSTKATISSSTTTMNPITAPGTNLLSAAAQEGNVAELRELLETKKMGINSKDDDERTALHWACASGNIEAVEFLLHYPNVNINCQDDSGWTPLMSAVSAGHFNIIKLLLESGANANISNSNGQIALHYHKNRQEVIEILLDYTTNIDAEDALKMTPLTRALGGKPSRGVVMTLLGHDASLKTQDIHGDTPLHRALMEEQVEIALLLAEHGASVRTKNRNGKSPLDLVDNATAHRLLESAKDFSAQLTP